MSHTCVGKVTYVRWHFNIRALGGEHRCVLDFKIQILSKVRLVIRSSKFEIINHKLEI